MKKHELNNLIDEVVKFVMSEIDLGTDDETILKGMRVMRSMQKIIASTNDDIEEIKKQNEEILERLVDVQNELRSYKDED